MPPTTSDYINTHRAGLPVGYVQRCSSCGMILKDGTYEVGLIGPNGEPPCAWFWRVGDYVVVDEIAPGVRHTYAIDNPDPSRKCKLEPQEIQ